MTRGPVCPTAIWHPRFLEMAAGDTRLVAHSTAVSGLCLSLSTSCRLARTDVIAAGLAGLLHDVGKCSSLSQAPVLHHLTGASFLQSAGEPRLARLVANHSGGCYEAELAGQSLAEFPVEPGLVADILAISDLVTEPDGSLISVLRRRENLRLRHGYTSDERSAIDWFLPDLLAGFDRVMGRLDSMGLRDQLARLAADASPRETA